MAIIFLASQKGGVGKTSLARLVAVEAARAKLDVAIADLDLLQRSCVEWHRRRQEGSRHRPQVAVEAVAGADEILALAEKHELVVVDGAPHSSRVTLDVARISHLVVIPTGLSLDDLDPAAILANNLKEAGIDAARIAMVLYAVGDSKAEAKIAREYLGNGGYRVLKGEVPFRVSYQQAGDRGQAISELPQFRRLRKLAVAMSGAIVDAIPA